MDDIIDVVRGLPGDPLLLGSLTPTTEGCVIGLSVSHIVADGMTIFIFFAIWTALMSGKKPPKPSDQRSFEQSRIVKNFRPLRVPLATRVQSRNDMYSTLNQEYTFLSLPDSLTTKLLTEVGPESPALNHIVAAHLLRRFEPNILPDSEILRLRIPIDMRNLHPSIDPLYLGNAFFDAVIAFSRNELGEQSLSALAYQNRKRCTCC